MIARALSYELEGTARAVGVAVSLTVFAIVQAWARWSLRRERGRQRS